MNDLFPYKNYCSLIMKGNCISWPSPNRVIAIRDWCNDTFGKNNYRIDFEDYGQHGEWVFLSNREDNFLMFKLMWDGNDLS